MLSKEWGRSQAEEVNVQEHLMPILHRLHGALVLGCYALCQRYEAEVLAWCKYICQYHGWGFNATLPEEEDEEEDVAELVQQSVVEGGQ